MGIPQNSYYTCNYENGDFQDYNIADILALFHKLYYEYKYLDSVYLSTTRVNNIFTY